MPSKFDQVYNSLIEEANKCTRETGIELSDHPDYRFSKCTRNPYSDGFRRVRFVRKDGSFDYKTRCKKPHRAGTESAETCKWYHRALKRRRLLAKLKELKKKLK